MPYFDTDTTLPNTNKKAFLVKYDTSGTYQWLKMPQPDTAAASSETRPLDMSVAPNGDIYWLSCFAPGNYDSNAFIVQQKKYYIIKYNSSGLFQQQIPLDMLTTNGSNPNNLDGITNAEAAYFARDHRNGRFYLAGGYTKLFGTLTFGSMSIDAVGDPGAARLYVTAFSSTGTNLWVKQVDPAYNGAVLYRPAINGQGHIFICGNTVPGNSFGGYTFTNLGFGGVPFLIALDTNGNNIWATNGHSANVGISASAIACSNNEVAVAGSYARNFIWQQDTVTAAQITTGNTFPYIARFNATTGQIIEMDSIPCDSTLTNTASALTADKKNNFYMGGRFMSKMYIGPNTLTKIGPGGSYDWFVAKFGTDNCDCNIPQPSFTKTNGSGNTVSFSYTGTTPYSSISWDFGNGSTPATTANPSHTYAAAGPYTVCVTVINDCGSNTACNTIQAGGGNSVANIPGFASISLYPNPANQSITIEHAVPGTTIEIHSVVGQRMVNTTLVGNRDIVDVSNLPPGLYIIRFTDKEGRQGTARFVKQ